MEVSSVDNPNDAFALPDVDQNIEHPSGTPVSGALPSFAVPTASIETKMDIGDINTPTATERVR